jgi:Ca-activated chloride channel family protein
MDQGARIPDNESQRGGFIQHDGQQVWSKMNGQVLSQIATETDGAYIPAGTKRVNMSDVYHGYVANVEQTEFETAKINAYIARFQWFAVPALALLLLEVFVSTRRYKAKRSQDANLNVKTSQKTKSNSAQVATETRQAA